MIYSSPSLAFDLCEIANRVTWSKKASNKIYKDITEHAEKEAKKGLFEITLTGEDITKNGHIKLTDIDIGEIVAKLESVGFTVEYLIDNNGGKTNIRHITVSWEKPEIRKFRFVE